MVRWGQVSSPFNIEEVARKAYRPDLFRAVADPLDIPIPAADVKVEGAYERSWILPGTMPIAMPASAFIDGAVFDPTRMPEYLESFVRHHLKIKTADVLAGAE